MANYINPFTDIGFKRIFGQELSKPLLIDFLNNLLIGEKRIVNLKFLDKELPPVFVDDRSLIYDIYCELDDNEKIIVEMQNCEQSYFKRRSIYYVSEAIWSIYNYLSSRKRWMNVRMILIVGFMC